jgi:uncharacterized protein
MRPEASIAVIYFSRSARAEAQAKYGLHRGSRPQGQALAKLLHTQSFRAVRATGLPVFHYHEGNQRGDSFGQRLSHAFTEVFALGYQAVVAVGNDSPRLGHTDWTRVVKVLLGGACAIGPSYRGGTYLIGLTRTAFESEAFAALPWQSSALLPSLTRYLDERQLASTWLPPLRDINSLPDLMAWMKTDEARGAAWFWRAAQRLLRPARLFPSPSLLTAAPPACGPGPAPRAPPR